MHDHARIVREFIASWASLDARRLTDYFAPNGCYHNMPMEPVMGRENIQTFIEGFLASWTATDWEIRNLVSSENVVIVERVDKTKTTAGDVDLPCVGVFEMEDGKIKVWRDYFDMATYTSAMK